MFSCCNKMTQNGELCSIVFWPEHFHIHAPGGVVTEYSTKLLLVDVANMCLVCLLEFIFLDPKEGDLDTPFSFRPAFVSSTGAHQE